MLDQVTAIRFDKPMRVGKTGPCLIGCSRTDGTEEEVVVKFLSGCEMKERSMATEALTALLAADLDLPVPEPFIVRIDLDFANSITDPTARSRAINSIGWNFGSKRLPSGFSTILKERPIPAGLMTEAAEVLAFDTFIANPDRTVDNPNSQTNGKEFAIFDHELALLLDGLLGWKNPWEAGGVQLPRNLPTSARHVFLQSLRGTTIDLSRFSGAFDMINVKRLEEYYTALPQEWLKNEVAIRNMLMYIEQLAKNIDAAISNLLEALR